MTTIIFRHPDFGVYRFCQVMTGSGRTGNTLVSYHGRTAVFHHVIYGFGQGWSGPVRDGYPDFRVV